MAESPEDDDPNAEASSVPQSATPPRSPRWVKVFVIVAVVFVVLLIVVKLVGGDAHGPSRHGGDAPPSTSASTSTPTPHSAPLGGDG